MPVEGEHYWRDKDGLWVENVGPWAKEKLKILTDYVQISSAARKKFSHCAFVDVFSGPPGKSKVRGTSELIDGSPVAAYTQAQNSSAFSKICISDADQELLDSATTRLRGLGAPVSPIEGPAAKSLPKIVRSLSPSWLHLAFLDPHNLGTLSFDLFECLAQLQRIDVIVHVSLGAFKGTQIDIRLRITRNSIASRPDGATMFGQIQTNRHCAWQSWNTGRIRSFL